MEIDDRIGVLADEKILGPDAWQVPLAERAGDPRLPAERSRLHVRLASIVAELLVPVPGAEPINIERQAFRCPRDEELPGWSSPLLAVDADELLQAEGHRLFGDVLATLARHYHFERPWHAVAAALFVLQAWVANALPAVFSLIIEGRYGGGKTSLLNLIMRLGGGVGFENVSVAALARELKDGRLVGMDEYDVHRSQDVQEVTDSLVRQGYWKDARPYTRYNASRQANEYFAVYGPKALTVRSFLDPALESRGFLILATPAQGSEAYELVLRNLWRELGDLPERGRRWGEAVAKLYPDERLKAIAESDASRARMTGVVGELGANRNVEIAVSALLVAEMAGVDVIGELHSAVELRQASIGSGETADREDVSDAIIGLSPIEQERLMEGSAKVRVACRGIKASVDRMRKERGDRPISDNRLSAVHTEVGASDSWKVRPGNRVYYDFPVEFVRRLKSEEGGANRPNRPNSADEDEKVRPVSPVRPGVRPGPSEPPAEPGSWQEGPVP